MKIPVIFNPKSVKGFIKGSLVLIGLFAVLYCGVAVFVLNSGDKLDSNKNIETNKNIEAGKNIKIDKKEISKKIDYKAFALILILTILPLMIFFFIFFKFSSLVKSYYKKLYGSTDGEGAYIKIRKFEMDSEKQRLEKEIERQKHEIENIERKNFEKHEQKMQETRTIIKACQVLVKTIKIDPEKEGESLNKILEGILEIFSEKSSKEKLNGDSCNSGN